MRLKHSPIILPHLRNEHYFKTEILSDYNSEENLNIHCYVLKKHQFKVCVKVSFAAMSLGNLGERNTHISRTFSSFVSGLDSVLLSQFCQGVIVYMYKWKHSIELCVLEMKLLVCNIFFLG